MGPKPNLFIIGAMKSGTTSLHNYLDLHPRIAMSAEKEPGYFVEQLGLSKGEQWYLDLFDGDPECLYRGESSTHYTKLPVYDGVAARIHAFNPQARLIYIMRDPFDRLISHYWHAVRDVHFGGELRSLIRAVHEKRDYLAFSDYAMQLEPYLRLFDRRAIFTLTFESLLRNPHAELDRICDWLEVDRLPPSEAFKKPHNEKPEVIQGVAGAGLLNKVQYSSLWDKLSPLVPAGLKNWAKGLAYKEIDEAQTAADAAELRQLLAPQLRQQVDTLSRLLGRDFPEWSTFAPEQGRTPGSAGANARNSVHFA